MPPLNLGNAILFNKVEDMWCPLPRTCFSIGRFLPQLGAQRETRAQCTRRVSPSLFFGTAASVSNAAPNMMMDDDTVAVVGGLSRFFDPFDYCLHLSFVVDRGTTRCSDEPLLDTVADLADAAVQFGAFRVRLHCKMVSWRFQVVLHTEMCDSTSTAVITAAQLRAAFNAFADAASNPFDLSELIAALGPSCAVTAVELQLDDMKTHDIMSLLKRASQQTLRLVTHLSVERSELNGFFIRTVATYCPLRILGLSDLVLDGVIDASSLSSVTTLKELRVNNTNAGVSHCLAAVAHLPLLEALLMKEIEMEKGALVGFLSGLKATSKLKHLTIHDSHEFDDECLRAVSHLPLELLDILSCSNIVDFRPIANLQRLKTLRLRECGISNADTEFIVAYLPLLEELDLRDCRHFTKFAELVKLPRLRSLNLGETLLDNSEFATIVSQIPTLRLLNVLMCPLSHLPRLPIQQPLRELNVGRTDVDDGSLATISVIDSLEVLNVSYCHKILSFCVLSRLAQLRCLVASGTCIDNDGLSAVSELPLERLALEECRDISDFRSLQKLCRLNILELQDTLFDNAGLAAISGLPIKELIIDLCENITDFLPLSKIRTLESLDAFRTLFNDEGVAAIAQLPHLRCLYLLQCDCISDVSSLQAMEYFPNFSLPH